MKKVLTALGILEIILTIIAIPALAYLGDGYINTKNEHFIMAVLLLVLYIPSVVGVFWHFKKEESKFGFILGIIEIAVFVISLPIFAHFMLESIYINDTSSFKLSLIFWFMLHIVVLYIPSYFLVFNRSQRNIFMFLLPVLIAVLTFGAVFGIHLATKKVGLEDGFFYAKQEDGSYSVRVSSIKGKDLDNFEFPSSYEGKPVTAVYECLNDDFRSVKSVIIPEGVTTIGENAFRLCKNLVSIDIPDSITTIGDFAFMNCTDLTSIVLPNGVTHIGEDAFSNCYSLTSIVLPNGITSIGQRAFFACSSLTSVSIPDSVTSIGEHAFFNCNLTYVVIPDSVTTIKGWAFNGCTNLTDVYYTGSEEDWENISVDYSYNTTLFDATIHYNYVPEEE